MIKAVIFDFDGLILDTETIWYEAFKEALLQFEVDLTINSSPSLSEQMIPYWINIFWIILKSLLLFMR